MIMRYHWGLAVGHAYARDVSATTAAKAVERGDLVEVDNDTGDAEAENVDEVIDSADDSGSASASEDSESRSDDETYDDYEFLARYEMYGNFEDDGY
jgi:hypothetical protein